MLKFNAPSAPRSDRDRLPSPSSTRHPAVARSIRSTKQSVVDARAGIRFNDADRPHGVMGEFWPADRAARHRLFSRLRPLGADAGDAFPEIATGHGETGTRHVVRAARSRSRVGGLDSEDRSVSWPLGHVFPALSLAIATMSSSRRVAGRHRRSSSRAIEGGRRARAEPLSVAAVETRSLGIKAATARAASSAEGAGVTLCAAIRIAPTRAHALTICAMAALTSPCTASAT